MIGVIGNLEVKVTDPENKQRISIYIDRDLVKKADGLLLRIASREMNL